MAITIISIPQIVTPAYNRMYFELNSTNKNLAGFKYVFDVYESGTANKIAEYKVYPRLGDAYGELDISKLLSTKVSFDLDPTNLSWYHAENSYYKYDVKYGEEYIGFYNYVASLTTGTGITGGASTRIIGGTNTFSVGDQVIIEQDDNGVANPLLEGLHTVVGVGATYIDVNVLFAYINDVTINGTVTYADNRKIIVRNLDSTLNRYVFNGAQSFKDFRTYSYLDYTLGGATDKFLTTQPATNFYCTKTQDIWVNIWNGGGDKFYMYFENNLGDVYRKPINSTFDVSQVSVGPNNFGTLTLFSGTGTGLLQNGVTWYRYWYGDNVTGGQASIKYRIDLDFRCKIEEYELLFLDRMGSFSSFAFQLRAYEKGTTKRETYNKHIVGSTAVGDWTYDSYDRGQKVINPTVERTLDLNTNWITEEMSVYFEELVTSPEVYLKDTDGLYYAVLITDTSFEINRSRNKNLFKKNVTIKYANDNIING
jgi:hypothetical protein